jgi:hypothetical protein
MIILGSPVAWRWKWHTSSDWQYGEKIPNDNFDYYILQPLYINPVENENKS